MIAANFLAKCRQPVSDELPNCWREDRSKSLDLKELNQASFQSSPTGMFSSLKSCASPLGLTLSGLQSGSMF